KVPKRGENKEMREVCKSKVLRIVSHYIEPHHIPECLLSTVMLCTPLKLRTTSVPTMGRVFKVEDVKQDLLVELDGPTIEENPFNKTHYILNQCSKVLPAMTENLPSDHSLKVQLLGFQNGALYCDG